MSQFVLQSKIDNKFSKNDLFIKAPNNVGVDEVVNFGDGISSIVLETEDKTSVIKFIGSHKTINEYFREIEETERDQYILKETLNSSLQRGDVLFSTDNSPNVEIRISPGIHSLDVESTDGNVYRFSGSKNNIDELFRYFPTEVVEEEEQVLLGEQGPPGPQGPRGKEGSVGPRGPKGEKGSPGLPGTDGSIGPKGEQGEQGPVGERGPQGDQGPVGDPGPSGKPGVDGKDGEVGPKGIQGNAGEIGPKGDPGEKGDQGEIGQVGPQGLIGPKGDPGEKGKQGSKGSKGSKGDKGDRGDPGTDGKEGPRGQRGLDGKQGPKGDKGDSGIVSAKYPLVYDTNGNEISFDTKKLEELLGKFSNLGPGQNGPDYAAMTDWLAAAGGAVAIIDGNNNNAKVTNSLGDFVIEGSGVSLNKLGKTVTMTISGGGGATTVVSDNAPDGIYVTGDKWIESDTGTLLTRYQAFWVEF